MVGTRRTVLKTVLWLLLASWKKGQKSVSASVGFPKSEVTWSPISSDPIIGCVKRGLWLEQSLGTWRKAQSTDGCCHTLRSLDSETAADVAMKKTFFTVAN